MCLRRFCKVRCHEFCRASYMPDNVRVLFIGESPPGSGDFFYFGTGRLFNHTYQVFAKNYTGLSKGKFLDFFRSAGCFLDDLITIPGVTVDDAKTTVNENENGTVGDYPNYLEYCIARLKTCWFSGSGKKIMVAIPVIKRVFDELDIAGVFNNAIKVNIPDLSKVIESLKSNGRGGIIVVTDNDEAPLPFPAKGRQNVYVNRLDRIIEELRKAGILP